MAVAFSCFRTHSTANNIQVTGYRSNEETDYRYDATLRYLDTDVIEVNRGIQNFGKRLRSTTRGDEEIQCFARDGPMIDVGSCHWTRAIVAVTWAPAFSCTSCYVVS